MPFSGGPSLIFAPSPASWQGKHHLRNAASCCASALPAEATTSNEANIQVFILDLLSILPTPPFLRARLLRKSGTRQAGGHPTGLRMASGAEPVNAPRRNLLRPRPNSIGGTRLRI